jgi:hypothetical protein
MTVVAGHNNKEVMMTVVARMMKTMMQISRMCLGSSTSTEGWLMASVLAQFGGLAQLLGLPLTP